MGVNTVLIDDPTLTTRLDGIKHRAKIIVFDRNNRLSGKENIFKHDPLIVTEPDLNAAMKHISTLSITRLMVEGGAGLISAFLKEDLYDQLYWFKAPQKTFDDDGLDAISHFDINDIEKNTRLKHTQNLSLNEDVLDIYQTME